MRTDDELTSMLRAGFDAATEDLAASPALATAVRRRHRVAQRRRLAVGVALPAAATAVGAVLVAGGRSPGPARIAEPSTVQPTTAATNPRVAPVSYRVVLGIANASPNCAAGLGPVGKTSPPGSVWVWSDDGTCLTAAVGFVDQLPAGAEPIALGGLPGLRGTTDRAGGTRTIYAPLAAGESEVRPDGGWTGLTVAADFPESKLVAFFVPTN